MSKTDLDLFDMSYRGKLRPRVQKHLPGQHDQKTHGNRKGKGKLTRGEVGRNGDLRRDGIRTPIRHEMVYPGDCYMQAGIFTNDNFDEPNTLVHGIIQHPSGHVAHSWVVLPDGYVFEPTTDAVYHPEDFERLFNPLVIQKYDPLFALQQMSNAQHYGPWDSISDAWYETYKGSASRGLPHVVASFMATDRVEELLEELDE